MSHHLIRPAIADDAEALSALAHLVAPYFTIHADGRDAELFFASITVAAMLERIRSSQYWYWVALDGNDNIVATIAIRDNAHVYHLFVNPDQHRHGYASQLWLHAKEAAMAAGNPGEFTVNSSLFARAMYEKFGFHAAAEQQQMHGLAFIPMAFKNGSPQ
jgi:GNAT superfamily N-acetyltransferase